MVTLYESAYAKLNLTLDVLGKREDGYHDLRSVMQTVSLRDDIEIDVGTGKSWCLKCNAEGVPCDERNLAWKAASVYCEAMNLEPNGLEIRITKRIPSQAGMGGGSADAAAVLRALNRHYGHPLTMEALADLGARIGSDVPFCVIGGTCMCEGRGEVLRPLVRMPDCIFVICKPGFPISTPELFRKIDEVAVLEHPDNPGMECALKSEDLEKIARNVYNVFDPVVSADHPELDKIKAVMNEYGALTCQMTGSGSATFAIVDEPLSAMAISGILKKQYQDVFVCKPV